MRAEELHVFLICRGKSKAAEKLSEAQKLLRQNQRWVYSEPGLVKTTCILPPVVSEIARTKSQRPEGIKKTNPEIIIVKIRTLEMFTQRNKMELMWVSNTNTHRAELNILTHDDQTGIRWQQKWNHY